LISDSDPAFALLQCLTDQHCTPDELDIRIACGVDYGGVLVIDNKDIFGDPVNRASKLGEDHAGPGEVLVTDEVAARVPKQAGIEFSPMQLSISGIEIEGFTVVYQQD
jgi:adenylate cyclase